jgi:hypothetical protein
MGRAKTSELGDERIHATSLHADVLSAISGLPTDGWNPESPIVTIGN